MAKHTEESLFIQNFIQNLIPLITGYQISDIKPVARDEVVKKSLEIFKQYVFRFVFNKYGEAEYRKTVKYISKYGDEAFFIFPDLRDRFELAVSDFVSKMQEKI